MKTVMKQKCEIKQKFIHLCSIQHIADENKFTSSVHNFILGFYELSIRKETERR